MHYISQLSKQEGKTFSAAMNVIYKDSSGNWEAYHKAHKDLQTIRTSHGWTDQQLQTLIGEYNAKTVKQ